MQRIISFIVLAFCNIALVYSQQKIDSIISALAKAKEDTGKVKLYLLAGRTVVYQDPNEAIIFYLAGARLSTKINYLLGAGLCYLSVGTSYSFISKVDSSLIYMDTSLVSLRKLNSADELEVFFSNRADIYVQMSDFKKALIDCDSATNYEDRVIDKTRLAYLYNVRADIYWHLKQYELNGEYVDKALAIHLASKNYRMVGQAYADKGDWFVVKKETEKGIEYYKKAIHIGDSLNDRSNLSRYHSLLSETYLDINKTSEALTEATAALKYAKDEDNPVQEAYVHSLLCKIFNQQNNLPAAISNGRLGHNMAIQQIDLPLQQSSAVALAAAFKSAGHLDSAYHYLQISKDLNDSLLTKNFNRETANLQISFEVSEKEKQIELLAKDKIIQAQELKRQQALKIGAMVLAVLAIGGIWLAVNRNRLRQQMKELQLRNQIAADLHDEVGSSLSSIHMLSQMATQAGNKTTHKDILERMSSNAKETMDKMGDIVWMIKPGETEGSSIKERMERFALEICSSKNIALQMQLDELENVKLSMEQKKNIYLIFKEAMNNAVKYSGTEKVEVSVSVQNKVLSLQIKDFGRGFDSSIVKKGNGLDNMQHRAKELKGQLKMNSEKGKGTTLELIVAI